MAHRSSEEFRTAVTFGRRKVKPRVCVADTKHHIRTFLREALEELGFIACECAQIGELDGVLTQHLPDLLLLAQRFLGSNHIRRPRPVCRTRCG
jgi:hypothetical protein